MENLKKIIEQAWENRSLLKTEETQNAIRAVIEALDKGKLRVAEPTENGWVVNQWVKKGVILYFPIQKMETIEVGPLEFHDKIPLKNNYAEKGIRVVPHAISRHGAYISGGTILMPSYVNIGAYVDGVMLAILVAWGVAGAVLSAAWTVEDGEGDGADGIEVARVIARAGRKR